MQIGTLAHNRAYSDIQRANFSFENQNKKSDLLDTIYITPSNKTESRRVIQDAFVIANNSYATAIYTGKKVVIISSANIEKIVTHNGLLKIGRL